MNYNECDVILSIDKNNNSQLLYQNNTDELDNRKEKIIKYTKKIQQIFNLLLVIFIILVTIKSYFLQNEITKVHGNEILKHYAELDSCEAIDKKLIAEHHYCIWDCNCSCLQCFTCININ